MKRKKFGYTEFLASIAFAAFLIFMAIAAPELGGVAVIIGIGIWGFTKLVNWFDSVEE